MLMAPGLTDLKKIDYENKINYEKVNKKLDELRNKSISWLNKAIDD